MSEYTHVGGARPRRRTGDDEELISALRRMDGRSYGSYKSLIGDWDYGQFSVGINRVQADPYAPPSQVHVRFSPEDTGISADLLESENSRVAVADFLVRAFSHEIHSLNHGSLSIVRIGQEIMPRSCVHFEENGDITVRFQVQLPARGRTILGRTAAAIFDEDIPHAVIESFDFISEEKGGERAAQLRAHVENYLDYCALRNIVEENSWVAFIADGSILARASGVSQFPLEGAIAWESPESLRRVVELPYRGRVAGTVIPAGLTLIVGGGYHGKSTLLNALSRGIYGHIPGDGRELVATNVSAVKVRASDGRSVAGVDVSPFITHLPTDESTTAFSTLNASGSTSQAASMMEAVELGASALLIDEDTSATNLLIRDSRMRALVADESEPITPLVDRITSLTRENKVSVVMVIGGSGAYLDAADTVIMMDAYRPSDVSEQAKEICAHMPRDVEQLPFSRPSGRVFDKLASHSDRPRTKVLSVRAFQMDKKNVELDDCEQLVDSGQVETIAWCVRAVLNRFADGKRTLAELIECVKDMADSDFDRLADFGARSRPAFMMGVRPIDVGMALNRVRGVQVHTALGVPFDAEACEVRTEEGKSEEGELKEA